MLPWVNGPVLGIPLCPLFASPSDPIRPPTPRVHFPEVSRERTGGFQGWRGRNVRRSVPFDVPWLLAGVPLIRNKHQRKYNCDGLFFYLTMKLLAPWVKRVSQSGPCHGQGHMSMEVKRRVSRSVPCHGQGYMFMTSLHTFYMKEKQWLQRFPRWDEQLALTWRFV